MVERFNGRISDIVNQIRFTSAAELDEILADVACRRLTSGAGRLTGAFTSLLTVTLIAGVACFVPIARV